MTREEERLEQAKFYKDKDVKDPHVHFLRGAEWADSTMLDKACEWLDTNYEDIGIRYIRGEERTDFIKRFKEAMKE